MEQLMTAAYNLLEKWSPFIWILIVIVIACTGVAFLVGGDTREKAIKGCPWILIGCALVGGATIIGKEIAAAFTF